MLTGEELKILGNKNYQEGNYEDAILNYTEAIQIDPNNSIYYNNRALVYFTLQNWLKSLSDASHAVKLDKKNVKGHYRMIKSLINLEKYLEARQCLSYAFKEAGVSNKDLMQLELELLAFTGIPVRPKSSDFEILHELGEGNFSSVIHVNLKQNKKEFAIKVIQRDTVERMKKRHPNIYNEILMEKKVLNKLKHVGIVMLFSTFQDHNSLYFLMEYLGGIDLWSFLHEMDKKNDVKSDYFNENDKVYRDKLRSGFQIGLHSTFLYYFITQILNVLEFMHQRGVVHRDLKPENIILTPSGHLKIIDFGTCKDLIDTQLNGPEFVGTPEYMSPEVITSSRSRKNIRNEADLWSLGVILYQFLFGSTPYASTSPFLIFLKIKRNLLFFPEDISSSILKFISILLNVNKEERLFDATGVNFYYSKNEKLLSDGIEVEVKEVESEEFQFQKDSNLEINKKSKKKTTPLKLPENSLPLEKLSYDKLRSHEFFTNANSLRVERFLHYSCALNSNREKEVVDHIKTSIINDNKYNDLNYHHNIFEQEIVKIPSLHDLALRATANTAYDVGIKISNNGGIRPKNLWLQKFKLYDYRDKKDKTSEEENLPQEILPEAYNNLVIPLLFPFDRQEIMRLLNCKNKLNNPSVYRLFFNSLIPCHFHRIINYNHSYLGHTHLSQGNYDSSFFFLQYSNPEIQYSTKKIGETQSEVKYREIISYFNKLRPKFATVMGNFIGSYDEYLISSNDSNTVVISKEDWYNETVKRFQSNSCRLSNSISVVYVSGENDFVSTYPLTKNSLLLYRKNFGSDYYIFWYGGLGLVVLNSLLLNHLGEYLEDKTKAPKDLIDEIELFNNWFNQLIEQIKLCGTSIMICSYLPWFHTSVTEEDSVDEKTGKYTTIKKNVRLIFLQKLRHHKVRFSFSSTPTNCQSKDLILTESKSLMAVKKSYKPSYPFLSNKLYYLNGDIEDAKRHEEDYESEEENEENDESSERVLEESEALEAEPVKEEESVILPDKLTEEEKKSFYEDNEYEESERDLESSDDEGFVNEENAYTGPEMVDSLSFVQNNSNDWTARIIFVNEETADHFSFSKELSPQIPSNSLEFIKMYKQSFEN